MKRILALAYTPKNSSHILRWRPFEKGDTLNNLVNNHNKKCGRILKDYGWLQEDIDKMSEAIAVVPYDLKQVDNLSTIDFKDILILLIDLCAIQGNQEVLDPIKVYMARNKHVYYLTQVSNDPSARSMRENFSSLPVYPYPPHSPHVVPDQEAFEHFLWYFCMPCLSPADTVGDGNGADIQPQVEALSRIADDVRHTAIVRNLSKQETLALARHEVLWERTFASIAEQVGLQVGGPVVLTGIRESVMQIGLTPYLQAPDLREVDVLQLRPTRSMRELTPEQRGIFHDLGIWKKTYTAVEFDKPSTWDLISRLGGAVEIRRFSAKLPFGKGAGLKHML